MNGNFVQVSGPSGRTQSFTPGSSAQTYIFTPQSLRGMLPGGDFVYADRIRFRITGQLTRHAAGAKVTPNWEILAQAFGQVRVYSPFLGEVVNKSMNSVPLVANHDSFFTNGFGPYTRKRGTQTGSVTTDVRNVEYEFAINFGRRYLTRPTDSCPWLPFFEGGTIELDLQPSTALTGYGWDMTGTWTCEVVIDTFPDRQALIHAPVAPRLYKTTTLGPEYILKAVGSPNGLDGVVPGCRLAVMSWLMGGTSSSASQHDSGFYSSFGGTGGILASTNGVKRMDIPFRDQPSIDAVSAWLGSFLADTAPVRYKANTDGTATETETDMCQWPYAMDAALSSGSLGQSLINDALDFWPLVWPSPNDKISDMQKADGDLSFTADLTTPPGAAVLHLFRTDEVCAFAEAKVIDLMERMGLKHVSRGGAYQYVPKYAGSKRADSSTLFGFPLKIVGP